MYIAQQTLRNLQPTRYYSEMDRASKRVIYRVRKNRDFSESSIYRRRMIFFLFFLFCCFFFLLLLSGTTKNSVNKRNFCRKKFRASATTDVQMLPTRRFLAYFRIAHSFFNYITRLHKSKFKYKKRTNELPSA